MEWFSKNGAEVFASSPSEVGSVLLHNPRRLHLRVLLGSLAIVAACALGLTGFWIGAVLAPITCACGLLIMERARARGAAPAPPEVIKCTANRAADPIASLLGCLSKDYHVISNLKTRSGRIDHLILRSDGALFMLMVRQIHGHITEEDRSLVVDNCPLEEDLLTKTLADASWLMERLAAMLGFAPLVHMALVFPGATTTVHKPISGVQVLESDAVGRWLGRPGGDPHVARHLWSRRSRLKAYLAATKTRHAGSSASQSGAEMAH